MLILGVPVLEYLGYVPSWGQKYHNSLELYQTIPTSLGLVQTAFISQAAVKKGWGGGWGYVFLSFPTLVPPPSLSWSHLSPTLPSLPPFFYFPPHKLYKSIKFTIAKGIDSPCHATVLQITCFSFQYFSVFRPPPTTHPRNRRCLPWT